VLDAVPLTCCRRVWTIASRAWPLRSASMATSNSILLCASVPLCVV